MRTCEQPIRLQIHRDGIGRSARCCKACKCSGTRGGKQLIGVSWGTLCSLGTLHTGHLVCHAEALASKTGFTRLKRYHRPGTLSRITRFIWLKRFPRPGTLSRVNGFTRLKCFPWPGTLSRVNGFTRLKRFPWPGTLSRVNGRSRVKRYPLPATSARGRV